MHVPEFLRNLLLAAAIALAATVGGLPVATRGDAQVAPRSFVVLNASPTTNINGLWLSPANTGMWRSSDELLQGQLLAADGGTSTVAFPADLDPSTCVFEVEIADDQGNQSSVGGINLCQTSTVTFFRGGTDWVYIDSTQ